MCSRPSSNARQANFGGICCYTRVCATAQQLWVLPVHTQSAFLARRPCKEKFTLSSHGSLQAQHFTISHSMPAVCITAACANTACLICVEFKQVGAAVKAHAAHEQMTACACKAPTGRDSSLFLLLNNFCAQNQLSTAVQRLHSHAKSHMSCG